MKRNLLIFVFFIAGIYLYAQVPQGFNYQAIARDNSGNPLQNTTLQVKLAIKADSSWTGTVIWEEIHNPVITNDFGLFTVVLGKGTRQATSTVATFNLIDWSVTPKFLRTEIYYGGSWKQMGISRLQSVPYAMMSAKAESLNAGAKVVSVNDATTDALFEVKRKDGQTVFAVYPDAVNIYVPSGSKGTKGGFAIGGFGDKAPSQDYFRVTPDSVRIYINNSPNVKGTKGGFAIGGFDGTKGILKDFFMNVSGTSTLDTVKGLPQVLWFPNKNAFLAGNVWIGHPDSVGLYSTALGYRSVAMGDYSQAFGYKAKALGNYSTSIGKNSVAGEGKTVSMNAFAFGDGAKATGADSYAFGSGATASGYRSFAFGSVGLNDSGQPTSTPTTASASYTVAIGMGARAIQYGGMALGIGSLASGYYSNSFGFYSTSSGYYSTALGYKSTASNYYAGALGYYATANGLGSLALGYDAQATQSYASAVGASSRASNSYASAFGRSANAQGNSSVAIGYGATTGSSATNASAFGRGANATGPSAMALGVNATASGDTSVAMGYLANASNKYAVAIGYSSKATAKNSFSFGYNSEAAGENSFAIGTYGLDASGNPNTSRPTKTSQSYSVAIGMGAQANEKGAMAFGVNTTASGLYSTAMGYAPTSSGQYSMALGYQAASSANYSTAVGVSSSASGMYSNSLGYQTLSAGNYSTALGYKAQANGAKSISIGAYYDFTTFFFFYDPILRKFVKKTIHITKNNVANDEYSIAIGNGNTASNGGMAFGTDNYASAFGATALGISNYADSSYSVAIGSHSNSFGYNAVAIGESVTAEAMNSIVIGYNNITSSGYKRNEWYPTDPLFVIGNGGEGTASNALVVQKNGNTTIYGNLTVNGKVGMPNLSSGSGTTLVINATTGEILKQSSSARYKMNISLLNDISWLYKLNPVTFLYKEDKSKTLQYGLIAEEVEKINPSLVVYDAEGKPDGLIYNNLISVLIKAAQEQKNNIEELKSENKMLKEKVEQLENIISKLIENKK